MAEPERVVRSVEQLRRQFGLGASDELERIRRRWPEVVGPAQAAATRPMAVRDGVLRVATADPAVIEALRWSEARIVADLSEGPDAVDVRAVRGVLDRSSTR